jgi:hypothetical protein
MQQLEEMLDACSCWEAWEDALDVLVLIPAFERHIRRSSSLFT